MDVKCWARKLIIYWHATTCSVIRYWTAIRYAWTLITFANELGLALRDVARLQLAPARNPKLLVRSELRSVFRGFTASFHESTARLHERLSRLRRDLHQAIATTERGPDPLRVNTTLTLNAAIMRREFQRLLGLTPTYEQASILAPYGSVTRALADFLAYCGYTDRNGYLTPTNDDLAVFTAWAQLRHTRLGATEALQRIMHARTRFSDAIAALRGDQQIRKALRADEHAWQRAQAATRDEWRLRTLNAARDLDPICQKIARCNIAHHMYTRALHQILVAHDPAHDAMTIKAIDAIGKSLEHAITC